MPLETIPPIPPELQDLAAWLMDAGQIEAPVEEIVQGCCRRLVAAGIPVCRINIGGLLLHPVHIVRTVIWDGDTGEVRSEALPREVLLAADAMESPFNWLESKAIPFLRCRLDVEDGGPSFPIFDRFRSQGMTDYFAFFRSNGRPRRLAWSDLPPGTDGIVGAWTTRQAGGFTDAQIAGLKAISRPLALTIKAVSADDLTATLLDTYLGRYTGQHVLQGRIGRGDGELVEAALWSIGERAFNAPPKVPRKLPVLSNAGAAGVTEDAADSARSCRCVPVDVAGEAALSAGATRDGCTALSAIAATGPAVGTSIPAANATAGRASSGLSEAAHCSSLTHFLKWS